MEDYLTILNASSITSSERVANGALKIRCSLFKEGVYDIDGAEVGRPGETLRGYYPLKEVAGKNSMSQLLTAPVTEGHHDDIKIDNLKTLKVGNILGEAEIVDGRIEADLLIDDPEIIEKINSKELRDVSPSFWCRYENVSDSYEGEKYDVIFKNIRFGHIGLLPPESGRMGPEVRLYNGKTINGGEMAEEKKDRNDGLAEQLEKLLKQNEELMQKVQQLEKLKEKNDQQTTEQPDKLKEENDQLKKENDQLKKEVSEEIVQKKVEEAIAQTQTAEEIDEVLETKISNSKAGGDKLYTKVLETIGIKSDGWTPAEKRKSFEVVHKLTEFIKNKGKEPTQIHNGAPVFDSKRSEFIDDPNLREIKFREKAIKMINERKNDYGTSK
jgi:hypothetical protein